MTDERKTIGSAGKAGRGNRQTSPSAAARALAGAPPAKKPVSKVKHPSEQAKPKPAAKKAAATSATAKKTTAKKAAAKPAAPTAAAPPKPRLRAVTDEDAAAAAAAAAEEAAKRTRTP